jgi:hypothetical protein
MSIKHAVASGGDRSGRDVQATEVVVQKLSGKAVRQSTSTRLGRLIRGDAGADFDAQQAVQKMLTQGPGRTQPFKIIQYQNEDSRNRAAQNCCAISVATPGVPQVRAISPKTTTTVRKWHLPDPLRTYPGGGGASVCEGLGLFGVVGFGLVRVAPRIVPIAQPAQCGVHHRQNDEGDRSGGDRTRHHDDCDGSLRLAADGV